MIWSLTSHEDHLWVSVNTVWGLTNSGGWITQLVVGSGCVPSLDTTKWPGPEHKASLTRNFGILKSRRDQVERSKKYRADLTHHYSSILLPSMWHRGAATLRSPPSNLLEPHVQENISLWIWIYCHQNGFHWGFWTSQGWKVSCNVFMDGSVPFDSFSPLEVVATS